MEAGSNVTAKSARARDALHNSLRSVVSRRIGNWAICYVAFLACGSAIGCKKTPCSPSRSVSHSLARVMQSIPSFLLACPGEI